MTKTAINDIIFLLNYICNPLHLSAKDNYITVCENVEKLMLTAHTKTFDGVDSPLFYLVGVVQSVRFTVESGEGGENLPYYYDKINALKELIAPVFCDAVSVESYTKAQATAKKIMFGQCEVMYF